MTDYATLEREIESLDEAKQNAVALFVRFLLAEGVPSPDAPSTPAKRPLGGYEAGFYMAPDFDAPLDDFAEYA